MSLDIFWVGLGVLFCACLRQLLELPLSQGSPRSFHRISSHIETIVIHRQDKVPRISCRRLDCPADHTKLHHPWLALGGIRPPFIHLSNMSLTTTYLLSPSTFPARVFCTGTGNFRFIDYTASRERSALAPG